MDPQQVGPTTDIYAFGGVAFLLLTGREVFQGKTSAKICQQVLNTPPSRPAACVDKEIPPELDELVFACLAKDPAKRPPDAAAVLESLERIETRTPWTRADARAWWDENRTRLQAASAIDPVATPAPQTDETTDLGKR